MQLKLTLPLPISVNKYLNYKIVWIGKKPIPQAYKPREVKEYERYATKLIQKQIKEQKWECLTKDNYIDVELTYYLNKKRKDSHNLEKVLFDVLMSAGAYPDDDILLPKTKNIYIDKDNPRVEVTLRISKKQGIFDDIKHLNIFKEQNCNRCKKSSYKRACGVFTRALENRICTEEIDALENVCKKIIN